MLQSSHLTPLSTIEAADQTRDNSMYNRPPRERGSATTDTPLSPWGHTIVLETKCFKGLSIGNFSSSHPEKLARRSARERETDGEYHHQQHREAAMGPDFFLED